LRFGNWEKLGSKPFNSLLSSARLVRLLSLPKLGEIGPVKPYPERSLLSIKTQWLTFDVRLYNIQPLIIEEAHEVQSIGSR
jgi:hypothetical protein